MKTEGAKMGRCFWFAVCSMVAVAVLLPSLMTASGAAADDPGPRQEAAFRTWTSTQGATLEARLVGVQGQEVRLETKDGRRLMVRTADLSKQDQEFLADTRQPGAAALSRQELDAWIIPSLSLRQASLQQAAAAIGESAGTSGSGAQLRVRVDNAQVANPALVTLTMQRAAVSEALFTVATVANAKWALVSNEVVFVATTDPRAEARRLPEAAPSVPIEPVKLVFKFEVFSVPPREEDELARMLPRPEPGVMTARSSQTEAMKTALRKLNMLTGKRLVAQFDLTTQSGLNVHDRTKKGGDEISVDCTPSMNPDGKVSALAQCMISDRDDDEHGAKGCLGQCLFEGASSQVLLQTRHSAEERANRPGKRYVVRVTCTTTPRQGK